MTSIDKYQMTKEEDSPAERVLKQIELRIRCSRSRFEVELLKGILLSAGITEIRNKTNSGYMLKQ